MPGLVAVIGPAGPHFVETIQRVWDRGDAFAPIDHRLSDQQRRLAIDAVQPTELIVSGRDGSESSERFPDGRPVDEGDALVIPTSGTEGRPKAVIHTHESVAASAWATSRALAVDPAMDKWLACLPLAHIGGLSVVLRSLVTKTPLAVHDGFDPTAVERSATEDGATLVSLVTRALNQIRPELFRTILLGGAAAPEHLPDNVVPTYGMTETGSGIVYGRRVLDGCEIALRDQENAVVTGTDTAGQIVVRGPMLFRAYRDGPAPFIEGGWFPTGDIGRWGPDGELVVDGRQGEVIVSGGQNIWPGPLERLLAKRGDVAEVAVVGRSDADWGHRVVAVVVPTDHDSPPSLTAVKDDVLDHFPSWWAPKELEIRREPMPRTLLGKLKRSEI